MTLVLTTEGREYAEKAATESMVARVALRGYDGEWPVPYVETAIRACNEKGAEERAKNPTALYDLPIFGWAWQGDARDIERR